MTAIAARSSDMFSVITTGRPPAQSLRALLGLAQGGAHLDDPADNAAQRNLWAAKLDAAVLRAGKPVLLVANGASCFAAAWWARLSPSDYIARIAGALLFDPPGGDRAAAAAERFASPRIALPFPSVVVSGRRSRDELQALAATWGSGLAPAPASGSSWQAAHEALLRVTAHIVERRMGVAEALGVKLDPPLRIAR